jgi:predicted GNAT superfamily acetyltransferase
MSAVTTPASATASAAAAASAASAAAGVLIRHLRPPSDFADAADLLGRIWLSPSAPAVSADLMRALDYAGGSVIGAFDGSELVGVAVAFLAGPHEPHLHSHVVGVAAGMQGRSVGLALKLRQRAWCLENGLDRMTWTFDPLIVRNAYFNIAKLGALVSTYLPDFYGEMRDGINAGYGSDRLLADWRLTSGRVNAIAGGARAKFGPAVQADRVALGVGRNGYPQLAAPPAGDGPVWCALPSDIAAIRQRDPDCAHAWRTEVRRCLTGLFASGFRIEAITEPGWYLLAKDEEIAE